MGRQAALWACCVLAVGGTAHAQAQPAPSTPKAAAPSPDGDSAPTRGAPGASDAAPGATGAAPGAADTPPGATPAETGAGQGDATDTGDDGESFGFDAAPLFTTDIYGYIDTQYSSMAVLTGLNDMQETMVRKLFREQKPRYFMNLNLMLQGQIAQRYHWFINLGAEKIGDPTEGDFPIGVRNAWVEAPLYRDSLVLRVGKTYRRFGLYNEILDAAPTFADIEPPSWLVAGQLLLTRTTNVMLHGSILNGEDQLVYTVNTGRDETAHGDVPVGGDVRYVFGDKAILGSSYYWSNDSVPSRAIGDGQPEGGVKDWMTHDEYMVYGGYGQLTLGSFLWQAEYWRADHDAQRNPEAMLAIASKAPLNMRRRQRFFNGAMAPTAADVNVDAEYAVQTAWTRFAYEFDLGSPGAVTPYLHLGWYSDPETVGPPALGGNEASLADDGVFFRSVVGFVYRPVPQVAFKAELNPHYQTVADKTVIKAPFQASLSYYWSLGE